MINASHIAMKPLEGSFAKNALEHGVAGVNIDDCRIGGEFVSAGGNNFDKWREAEGREDMLSLLSSFSSRIYGKRSAEGVNRRRFKIKTVEIKV